MTLCGYGVGSRDTVSFVESRVHDITDFGSAFLSVRRYCCVCFSYVAFPDFVPSSISRARIYIFDTLERKTT